MYNPTPEQIKAVEAAGADKRVQSVGMAKWNIILVDGKKIPYLTNDCRDKKSALVGAIERFGKKVKDIE